MTKHQSWVSSILRRLAFGFVASVLVVIGNASPTRAHSMRAGYLRVWEQGEGISNIVLRLPLISGQEYADVRVVFPENCRQLAGMSAKRTTTSVTRSWSIRCDDALVGKTIEIAGLNSYVQETIVDLRLHRGIDRILVATQENSRVTALANENEASPPAAAYFQLGVEHIWSGIDHLLFVLGLLFVVIGRSSKEPTYRRIKILLSTVTSFTIAHSITLAAVALTGASFPTLPVEVVIALSILLLAIEIARKNENSDSLTFRYPWLVAFAFGLIHGFGFAGALSEIGFPQNAIALALLLFNLGVEAGQLAFVAMALVIIVAVRRFTPLWQPRLQRVAIVGIGTCAVVWCLERFAQWTQTLSFFS